MKLLKTKMIRFFLILAFLSSSVFAKKIMPSVEDIDGTNKNKFDVGVYKCISDNAELKQIYMEETVKIVIQQKHKNATNCADIQKSLENVLIVKKSMQNIANIPECSENVNQQNITLEQAKEIQEKITEEYNKIAQDYTQFFTYDANLSNVEGCMNFYDEFITVQNLNLAEQKKAKQLYDGNIVAQRSGLFGIYGNKNGAKGLNVTITEIQAKEIKLREISQYAILEYDTQNWKLVGAFDNKLVYSDGSVYIGFKIQKGLSYSADTLPHSLFQIQKKVDIKKNGYSIFIVKPLI